MCLGDTLAGESARLQPTKPKRATTMTKGTCANARAHISRLAAPLRPPQAPTHTMLVPLQVRLCQVLLLDQSTLPLRAVAAPAELYLAPAADL